MRVALGIAALLVAGPAAGQPVETFDAIFASRTGNDRPGCVVGAERKGEAALVRAYGSADLEHAVPLTGDTILEAGSVSKQFTAAAILLLVGDGKLALDSDVRSVVPELPGYGAPVTIDHLLNHTSGLRDWGAVADLAGWPRGTRAYAPEDALAIIVRQRALNYPPGAEYAYTNSGYNLLATIVERVSGQSLAAFTRDRLFAPLGMTATSWRDDFRRIVRNRAVAYAPASAGFEQAMPFENAYGNGGLLTTVGDLLKWNRALDGGTLGAGMAERLAEPALLASGRRIAYARGLRDDRYRDQQEIAHAGATGGYRAWLARYPAANLSIAILCNDASANPIALGREVVDRYLGPASSPPPGPLVPAPQSLAGRYVNAATGMPVDVAVGAGSISVAGGTPLTATSPDTFTRGLTTIRFAGDDAFTVDGADGVSRYRRLVPYLPDAADLDQFTGRFASDEALAAYMVTQRNGSLEAQLVERPHVLVPLVPLYRDAFMAGTVLVRFTRDRKGGIDGLTLGNERVRALQFRRMSAQAQ